MYISVFTYIFTVFDFVYFLCLNSFFYVYFTDDSIPLYSQPQNPPIHPHNPKLMQHLNVRSHHYSQSVYSQFPVCMVTCHITVYLAESLQDVTILYHCKFEFERITTTDDCIYV